MRELPAGTDAVVLDFSTEEHPADAILAATSTLRRALAHGRLPGITDVIPSAHTVLLQARPGCGVDILGVHRELRSGAAHDAAVTGPAEVRIPVTYDGADLDDVARRLGITSDAVVALHRDTLWRVQFMGFAPGFGYLVANDGVPHPFDEVGRRDEPRTRVPAGAVAIAAGYSAIYPRMSPGGWHLLGHTTIELWNTHADPPALLAAGTVVRFVDAGERRR